MSSAMVRVQVLTNLNFDIVPVNEAKLSKPTWRNSPITGGFPIVDEDIEVELSLRDPETRRNFTFLGSDETMALVSEELSVSY